LKLKSHSKVVFSVGGGKGGVGKSIFSIAFGAVLAKSGQRVILVDLDLGASNLHTYLGITKKTPTMADFILRRVPSLEDLLIETSVKNLQLISGAEFVPGMANPAHWMKLKIMRHVKSLPADTVIIDLGAGVHFNTLDFFGISDRGIVMTAPEPGAVMNAYGFIKGALFRKLQGVFRKHSELGPMIESEMKRTDESRKLTLEWLTGQIKSTAPEVLSLIEEIERSFCPALVVNRVAEDEKHILVENLIALCNDKLGVPVEHMGNLPDIPDIRNYLLKVPEFLTTINGKSYEIAVRSIVNNLRKKWERTKMTGVKDEFSDEDIEGIIRMMDELDENVYGDTNKDTWKLRMYFKPSEVVNFLLSQGVKHELLYPDND
jgi:flagellar biosynthesis protein FlhG